MPKSSYYKIRRPGMIVFLWVVLQFLGLQPALGQPASENPLFVNAIPDHNSIFLKWNTVSGADQYRLKWRPDNVTPWHETVVDARTEYALLSLLDGQLYQLQVEALAAGESLAASALIEQTPRPRVEDPQYAQLWRVFASWWSSNAWLAANARILDPTFSLDEITCRGVAMSWDPHVPDCVMRTPKFWFYLLRELDYRFNPPQDERSAEQIRQLARSAIWGNLNPFTHPEAYFTDISEDAPPVTGGVSAHHTATSYTIRYHLLFSSRVTWFIPENPIPGQYAIYHEGHTSTASAVSEPDAVVTIDWLLRRGWQVIAMDMPLYGRNIVDRSASIGNHGSLEYFDTGTISPLSLFFLPVKAVVDMIDATEPGDPKVLMIGRSGGGWSTYTYAPLDPRIDLAIPVAGGLPMSLRGVNGVGDIGDYEQFVPHWGVVTQEDLMRTAGTEGTLLIYNRADPCCFAVDPEHPEFSRFLAYMAEAEAQSGKPTRVFVDLANTQHSIGTGGYAAIDELLGTVQVADLALEGQLQAPRGVTVTLSAMAGPAGALPPITYTWTIDEIGVLTQTGGLTDTQQVRWETPGIHQVEVIAANAFGAVAAQMAVHVLEPLVNVQLQAPAVATVQKPQVLTASIAPLQVATPITYHWTVEELGAITRTGGLTDVIAVQWDTTGIKNVQVVAMNALGPVTATAAVLVSQPVTTLQLSTSLTGYVQVSQTIAAVVLPPNALLPITYTWNIDGIEVFTRSGGLTDTVTVLWPTTGAKQVGVVAANALASVANAVSIEVKKPFEQVVIVGPERGVVGVPQFYSYQLLPPGEATPASYTWEVDDLGVFVGSGAGTETEFVWMAPGPKYMKLTACNGNYCLSTSLMVLISPAAVVDTQFPVFLPAVAKDSE